MNFTPCFSLVALVFKGVGERFWAEYLSASSSRGLLLGRMDWQFRSLPCWVSECYFSIAFYFFTTTILALWWYYNIGFFPLYINCCLCFIQVLFLPLLASACLKLEASFTPIVCMSSCLLGSVQVCAASPVNHYPLPVVSRPWVLSGRMCLLCLCSVSSQILRFNLLFCSVRYCPSVCSVSSQSFISVFCFPSLFVLVE